ncbi:MAG: transposase [Crocinitomicaceae bacterium]|jgi:transposase
MKGIMLQKQHESWVLELSLRKTSTFSYRWKKEQEEAQHNSFSGHGKAKLTDEGREIARLKKELRDAKMEAEILKKAIGIFSMSDSTNLDS